MALTHRRFTYMMPLPVGAIEDHMGARDVAALDRILSSGEGLPAITPPSADLWDV